MKLEGNRESAATLPEAPLRLESGRSTKSELTLKLRAIRPTANRIHKPVRNGKAVRVQVGNKMYVDRGRGWRFDGTVQAAR